MRPPALRRLFFIVLIIVSTLSLPGKPSSQSYAASEPLRWSSVNTPREGSGGGWQLASGSDIYRLVAAKDGTLYTVVNTTGSNYTVYKSQNGGVNWAAIGNTTAPIAAIAAAPDDPKVIYYATQNTVYRYSDLSGNFTLLPLITAGLGTGNHSITTLAVGQLNSDRMLAVGTKDWDTGQFGRIYTLNESYLFGGWTDTGLTNCDVLCVAFSPRYSSDRQLIAAGSTENGTIVTFRSGSTGWGMSSGNVTINGIIPRNCVAAVPDDFESTLFLGIDTGANGGDVFRINRQSSPNSSTASDLNAGAVINMTAIDAYGLAVSGSSGTYRLIAGAANSTRILFSTDAGSTWNQSAKQPAGESKAIVAMAPDYLNSLQAYVAASGYGSAFSCSNDAGLTWNGLSLIDTTVDAMVDFALSPRYGQDNTLFLLTWGGEHSLWRTQNGGSNWERIFVGSLGGGDTFSNIEVSPQYGAGDFAVVLAGSSGGGAVWKSNDKGQTFTCRVAGFPIDVLTIAGSEDLFVGSYNGTDGLIYHTSNGGMTYSAPALTGKQPIASIVISPTFQQDRAVLVGNSNGWVYLSGDNGASFQTVPGGLNSPPLTGNIRVAFDWQFAGTRTIYAASDNASTSAVRSRLYRYTLGRSGQWEQLDATVESGGRLGQICILPGGSLYSANSRDNGGMERSLNPGATSYPVFETVNTGLAVRATLTGLWGYGNQLWSLDTRNNILVTYVDSLVAPVVPANPAAAAPGVDPRNVTLDWGGMAGAVTYEWQMDNDGSFSAVPNTFKGETAGTSVRLPRLEPASLYYWRARVKAPTLSPWSPVRNFYTILGTPGIPPALYLPKSGADGIGVRPVFQWEPVSGAERYELLVAGNPAFNNPVIAVEGNNALYGNAWQCDVSLSYNTTYYWKIRGVSSTSCSVWSGTGVFTTITPVVVPVPQTPSLSGSNISLIIPPYEAVGVSLKPVFEWNPVSGAEKYELMVSKNSSFTEAEIMKIGTNAVMGTIWQSDATLQFATKYFWRVRGVRGSEVGGWSAVNSFTTLVPVSVPVMKHVLEPVYPRTGTEGVAIRPVFQWKPIVGATSYELLVSDTGMFNSVKINRSGGTAIPSEIWQNEQDLAYNTTYYWKVRAIIAGNVTDWSEVNAFTTLLPPPIVTRTVELESPAAGAETVSVTPIFQWKALPGAERYELFVSARSDFTNYVITKTGLDALPVTAWRCDVSLTNDTTFYWKVRAVNSGNMSVWSNPSAFRTVTRALPPEITAGVEPPLTIAGLISPSGSFPRTNTKPLFQWKPVAGAEKYELLASRELAFVTPEIIRVGAYAIGDCFWQTEVELDNDTTYWWKVRAVSGGRSSEWSVPAVFITEPAATPHVNTPHPGLPSWVVYSGAVLITGIGVMGLAIVTLLIRLRRS